jgi:hypothetical protein
VTIFFTVTPDYNQLNERSCENENLLANLTNQLPYMDLKKSHTHVNHKIILNDMLPLDLFLFLL